MINNFCEKENGSYRGFGYQGLFSDAVRPNKNARDMRLISLYHFNWTVDKNSKTGINQIIYIFTVCATKAVGVANSLKTIPDAQMSGYYADISSSHKASEGRLGSGTGWIGSGTSSWLQVGFIKFAVVHHFHRSFLHYRLTNHKQILYGAPC